MIHEGCIDNNACLLEVRIGLPLQHGWNLHGEPVAPRKPISASQP